jgi:2-keto-4-pentenoate hydratase/2-oxohepta-3-ene-1,7-dioic acid hydratase in catechol pathway
MPAVQTRRILLDGIAAEVAVSSATPGAAMLVAADGRQLSSDDAVHLPPCQPTKILCVHLNYRSRITEFGSRPPGTPTYFHKPVSALNSHGGAIVRPAGCQWLNYEGEIGIVIGATCRNVSPADAGAYVGGYTIGNDFGLHDFRDTDAGSMLRVKGSDTLCPLGPGLVRGWDFRHKSIRTTVNGRQVQSGSTDEMLFDRHPGRVPAGPAGRRGLGRGGRARHADEHHRDRPGGHPGRRRRPAVLLGGGHVDGPGRRLGVPRHPPAPPRLRHPGPWHRTRLSDSRRP